MKLATAFSLACSIQLALSQSIINNYFNIPRFEFGFCPSFRTVPDFDRERYYGAWYSQLQVPSTFQPEDMSCVRAFYRPRKDDTVSVYNTGTDSNGVLIEICGKAWQDDKENPGSWRVRQVLIPFTNPLCDITTHDFNSGFRQALSMAITRSWMSITTPTRWCTRAPSSSSSSMSLGGF